MKLFPNLYISRIVGALGEKGVGSAAWFGSWLMNLCTAGLIVPNVIQSAGTMTAPSCGLLCLSLRFSSQNNFYYSLDLIFFFIVLWSQWLWLSHVLSHFS
jgi:hypothetical protein